MKIDIEKLKALIKKNKEERDDLNRNISSLSVRIQMQEEVLRDEEEKRDEEENPIGKYYKVGFPEINYFLPIRIIDSSDVFIGLYLNSSSIEPINTSGAMNKCWLIKGREITPKEFWEKFDKIVEGIKAQYCIVWKNE